MSNGAGEALRDLPPGWAWASIADLKGISGLLTDGDWILAKEFLTGDDVRLIQLGDIGEGYFLDKTNKSISSKRAKELNCTFLSDDDVLISRMAHPLARACRLPNLSYKCITAVDVSILRPDKTYFDSGYITWLFNARGVRQQAEALSSGTTRKRISRKNLEILSVPIPPINEQHRIVAKIEELFTNLDAGIEALKMVQAQIKRYRQAVLKYAFEGKLTAEWREANKDGLEPASVLLERIREERKKKLGGKYKESPAVDTADLPELPDGWAWSTGYEIFDFVTSGSRGWAKYYSSEGPLFIRMGNLTHDSISIDHIKEQRVKPPAGSEGKRTQLFGGDILISITADVGRIAVVPDDIPEAYINQHVALARSGAWVSKNYLAWHLQSSDGQRQLLNLERGATKTGLGLDDIRAVRFPIPPSQEQEAITEIIERKISITDAMDLVIDQNIKKSDRLHQSVLKKAFEGRLVPQDPSDEPAEKLLERIKQERAKQLAGAKNTRGRKRS